MDTVQIEQFKNACAWSEKLDNFIEAINTEDYQSAIKTLDMFHQDGSLFISRCRKKAVQMGCWTDFSASDMGKLFSNFVKMAFARIPKESLEQVYETLTSKNAMVLDEAFRATPLNEAVTRFRGLSNTFGGILQAAVDMLGISSEEVKDVFSRNPTSLGTMNPEIIFNVFGSMADERGVDVDSKFTKQIIKEDFSIDKLRDDIRNPLLEGIGMGELDNATGLSSVFLVDLNRATFIINGKNLTKTSEGKTKTREQSINDFLNAFKGENEEVNMDLARTVSLCMNQTAINFLHNNYSMAAIGSAVLTGLDSQGNTMLRAIHNAHKDEEGNWFITSQLTYGLTGINRDDGFIHLDTDVSVLATSLTFKIPRESIEQGNPSVELVDTNHFITMERQR